MEHGFDQHELHYICESATIGLTEAFRIVAMNESVLNKKKVKFESI